jgi:hypothetical protein
MPANGSEHIVSIDLFVYYGHPPTTMDAVLASIFDSKQAIG